MGIGVLLHAQRQTQRRDGPAEAHEDRLVGAPLALAVVLEADPHAPLAVLFGQGHHGAVPGLGLELHDQVTPLRDQAFQLVGCALADGYGIAMRLGQGRNPGAAPHPNENQDHGCTL